ncbi:hypothetical protein JCM10449v2_004444 [Rhodotorula kratochvilovae]
MQAALGTNQFSAPTMDPFEAWAVIPDKPPPPPARIRPFNPETDLNLTRFLVGSAVMEPSSQANQAGLFKPLSLGIWLALVHVLVTRVASGYPAVLHNYLFPHSPKAVNPDATFLQTVTDAVILIPLLIAPAIALLALFEWRHRNLFEMEMRRAIGEEDMRDVQGYYGVQPEAAAASEGEGADAARKKVFAAAEKAGASQPQQRRGFWVLEYDNRLIGVVGLDGSKPGQPLDSVVDRIIAAHRDKKRAEDASSDAAPEGQSSATAPASSSGSSLRARGADAPSVSVTPPTPLSGTAPSSFTLDPSASLPDGTLHLRRFGTSMSFRSAGIEDDLLSFVADYAFSPTPAGAATPDGATLPAPAKQLVVTLIPAVQRSLRAALARNGFELVPRGSELELPQSAASGEKSLAARLWPVDLAQRTMVLRRATWEDRRAKAQTAH